MSISIHTNPIKITHTHPSSINPIILPAISPNSPPQVSYNTLIHRRKQCIFIWSFHKKSLCLHSDSDEALPPASPHFSKNGIISDKERRRHLRSTQSNYRTMKKGQHGDGIMLPFTEMLLLQSRTYAILTRKYEIILPEMEWRHYILFEAQDGR